ncbi:MAG: DUF2796 domain-containing protein [Aestuariibacter sp.]|nr:DUF2796 domain-containing protein [Aestuariibacter sp.]
MKLSTAVAVATAIFTTLVFAQTERDLGSHDHGTASLNIAIDENSVFLELDTPWNNLVGFEHVPRTSEQHTLVDDALTLLNQPNQLFLFDGTDCVLAEIVLDSSIAEKEGDDHQNHEDEKHHNEKQGSDTEAHASVLVSYSFNCDDVTRLTAIDVKLLVLWSGFEDLDVQLIGPGGQASVELNPQQLQIDISQIQ